MNNTMMAIALFVGGTLLLLRLIDSISWLIRKKLREKRRKTMSEENTYWVCYDILPYKYERTFVRAKSAQEAVDIVAAEKKARNVEIKNIQVFKRELPEGTDSQYFWTPSAPKEEDK